MHWRHATSLEIIVIILGNDYYAPRRLIIMLCRKSVYVWTETSGESIEEIQQFDLLGRFETVQSGTTTRFNDVRNDNTSET